MDAQLYLYAAPTHEEHQDVGVRKRGGVKEYVGVKRHAVLSWKCKRIECTP